jgi:very-short-patch-repair endonuclease
VNDWRGGQAREIWLREAARDLRRRSTATEQRLWSVLRGRRLAGRRFRRQHPIGPHVVDFLCFAVRLVVEIDGGVHERQQEYDAERDRYLAERGYRVVRVPAERIVRDLPGVLAQVERACQTPPPSRETLASDL